VHSVAIQQISSPVGVLTVAAHGDRICALHFGPRTNAIQAAVGRWYPGARISSGRDDPAGAVTALHEYFNGNLRALEKIQVELNGTAFQLRVWHALRAIGPGRTVSYSAIARAIGAPNAVRAVGAANGANPVALIVPCHRVIGADGTLTGYGGGLDRKQWLLRHERAQLPLFETLERRT
jgi:methylated-DNA-[protein]-cysteine S-methyltransferase